MGGCNSIAKRDAQAALSLPATLALMTELYGKSPEQIGFTDGHNCVTEKDKRAAAKHGASLLYGEILPQGASRRRRPGHRARGRRSRGAVATVSRTQRPAPRSPAESCRTHATPRR